MQSKIKQITLLDGKMFLYPTDTEIKNLNNEITSVIVEEIMTKQEYDNWIDNQDFPAILE